MVTFTEAATKELRDRIRARLTQAAEVFSDNPDDPNPPAETALIYQLRDQDYPDPATWPECRKRLLLAAEWMDEAAVSTIHGWCNRMLSEHAFDSGSLFRISLETDQSELLDEVVRDYWRTFAYPLPAELMEELLDHWKTPSDLRKAVRNLLSEKPPAPSGNIHNAIDAAVRERKEERTPSSPCHGASGKPKWKTCSRVWARTSMATAATPCSGPGLTCCNGPGTTPCCRKDWRRRGFRTRLRRALPAR